MTDMGRKSKVWAGKRKEINKHEYSGLIWLINMNILVNLETMDFQLCQSLYFVYILDISSHLELLSNLTSEMENLASWVDLKFYVFQDVYLEGKKWRQLKVLERRHLKGPQHYSFNWGTWCQDDAVRPKENSI